MKRIALAALSIAVVAPATAQAATELTFSRPEAFGGGVFMLGSGKPRHLVNGSGAAWSPDGRRIAVVAGAGAALRVVDPDGRYGAILALGPVSSPDWSPDAKKLVFERFGWIHVVDADSPLTADRIVAASPAWSPDGRRIAYVSSRATGDEVWSVPAGGGTPRRVATGPAEHPHWRPRPLVQELLPDLDQQPPSDLDVRPDHGRYRLWFTAATDNIGLGPLIVSGRRSRNELVMHARQWVRLSDGGTRAYPRVGLWRYNHSAHHSHWHLLYYQRYELLRADGSVVVRDRKSGFCLGDRYGIAPGHIPHRVRRPVFTGFCNLHEPNSTGVQGGTSIGFSDRYHSRLDGQNVDITHVPAGEYVLVHRTNTRLLIKELRYTNNAASVRIRLSRPNGRSGPPTVRVLRICADSDRCA